jgi:hypothetical protein
MDFWNYVRYVCSKSKDDKKKYGSNKIKESKQDSQNLLWLPIFEGGEPLF